MNGTYTIDAVTSLHYTNLHALASTDSAEEVLRLHQVNKLKHVFQLLGLLKHNTLFIVVPRSFFIQADPCHVHNPRAFLPLCV